ncbi:uncharacterized protein H6S33_009441 [Morchella sextelata]|uniref:uncharacterized protein n=1 Tax=Morchella sextelata TaxID=1174677 RepID=UPI001D04E622|nr:uncharacterized protein H6S33_009441 [Morchella sextelata]KAH0613061.1 hypothetical protein H6S33_009441 [Morchella sextelata]
MDTFFAQYPTFTRPSASGLVACFKALSVSQAWTPEDEKTAKLNFKAAMVQEFNNRYGTNEKDLESWRNLCRVFGIGEDEMPESITKCKKEIAKIHVNLVDLIELPPHSSGPVTAARIFPTLKALKKYTKKTGKYFSRNDAKAGGILKSLLRKILR